MNINLMSILLSIVLIPIAYFIGSIPTGVWYTKFFHNEDIRTMGSGNSGTTNVGRNFGMKAAVIVALVDVLKGYLPTIIAINLLKDFKLGIILVAIATIIGHAYPYFADFKGGKIVATSIGILLAYNFPLALIQVVLLFTLLYITSVMSFSALLSYGATVIYIVLTDPSIAYKIGFLFIFIFMCYRHKNNLINLYKGTERQISWGLHKLNR